MAPSKTYNVPGLGTSVAIIPDTMRRARFVRAASGIVAEVTSLGFAACEAAYRDCEPWRQGLLAYLRVNRDFFSIPLPVSCPVFALRPQSRRPI
jgi:cystathionine beta-lyase